MMGDMTTGSVGKSAEQVKTVEPGEGEHEISSADEAVEDQSVEVDGPSEALSADKKLEGKEK